jgi:LAO/AO transport system kinase
MSVSGDRFDASLIPPLVDRLKQGDRRAAARLMTLLEWGGEYPALIIKSLYPYTPKAKTIGITGSPGVGKSTLINIIAEQYLSQNLKVGIIMVDPSSPYTGGAILGDRIRLKNQFSHNNLFIRSMANRSHLGGLASATHDMMKILDVWGADLIILETVGVGQSEVEISTAANTVILVLAPEMGDDIQAFKAGIMEITDIYVVSKMDLPGADKQVLALDNMLNMGEIERERNWRPPVVKVNGKTGENIQQLLDAIANHQTYLQGPALVKRLKKRFKTEILDILKAQLVKKVEECLNTPEMDRELECILNDKRDPYSSAEHILRSKLQF